MAAKVVLMMTLMVLFSLGTMPASLAATRLDVAQLISAIDIPTECEECNLCTKSIPPFCYCSDLALCTKCVCYKTVPAELRPLCEGPLASKFVSYCPIST